MKKSYIFLFAFTFFSIFSFSNTKSEYLKHSLNVSIEIENSALSVTDTICFPKNIESIQFFLNPNLEVVSSNAKVEEEGTFTFGNKNYKVILPKNSEYLILSYRGEISNNKELFVGSDEGKRVGTSGLIHEGGAYLSGSTYWVPSFEAFELFTYELTTHLPLGWKLVTQGEELSEKSNGKSCIVKYFSDSPTTQIYLVANKWTEYSRVIAGKNIRVFLINPDEALAQRYLGVTAKYMMMYQQLIGNYPYKKFDVVENFWETGYGMPSFTLLGQQVIRFPWILASSYPHEYLHNYWGNSVFVDYESGNWCEGITTYMADYLLKEQKAEGVVYRRNMLKKYSDYVTTENDYPVSKFKSKTDEVSDAIGYGKVFMINHMLRKKYGVEKFIKAYAHFYDNNKFEKASFLDIQKSFEEITNEDLSDFFAQWINKKGAPSILLKNVSIGSVEDKYQLNIELEQKDINEAFAMEVPVLIYFDNSKKIIQESIHLNDWTVSAQFFYKQKPIRIDVDPQFDVMRRLDKNEVPATFSAVLGDKNWLIVLPKLSSFYGEYKALASSWQEMYASRGKNIIIIDDDFETELPKDKSVWLMGQENKFNKKISVNEMYGGLIEQSLLDQLKEINENGVLVYMVPNPNNIEQAIVYFNSSNADNIQKMAAKLMHYGSYSYLGFDAEVLENILSGTFPIKNSPLTRLFVFDEHIDWSKFSLPKTDILF